MTGEVPDLGSERARLIGYVSGSGAARTVKTELDRQARLIARECERRGFQLVQIVNELAAPDRRPMTRPGLAYALRRISEQHASGLIVAELGHLASSAAELGQIIEWLRQHGARLAAAAEGLDTDAAEGRLAAALLVNITGWERARLSERTRNGLMTAESNGRSIGRPAIRDNPALRQRIVQMRRAGMTLQAIADRLNEEGVPTVRGGSLWRHSSVQVAAGYRRRPKSSLIPLDRGPDDRGERGDEVSRENGSPA